MTKEETFEKLFDVTRQAMLIRFYLQETELLKIPAIEKLWEFLQTIEKEKVAYDKCRKIGIEHRLNSVDEKYDKFFKD